MGWGNAILDLPQLAVNEIKTLRTLHITKICNVFQDKTSWMRMRDVIDHREYDFTTTLVVVKPLLLASCAKRLAREARHIQVYVACCRMIALHEVIK